MSDASLNQVHLVSLEEDLLHKAALTMGRRPAPCSLPHLPRVMRPAPADTATNRLSTGCAEHPAAAALRIPTTSVPCRSARKGGWGGARSGSTKGTMRTWRSASPTPPTMFRTRSAPARATRRATSAVPTRARRWVQAAARSDPFFAAHRQPSLPEPGHLCYVMVTERHASLVSEPGLRAYENVAYKKKRSDVHHDKQRARGCRSL